MYTSTLYDDQNLTNLTVKGVTKTSILEASVISLVDQPTQPLVPTTQPHSVIWAQAGTPDNIIFTDNQGNNHTIGGSQAYQTQKTLYTITSADVLNGYAVVNITWPTVLPNLNFVSVFSINDLDDIINIDFGVGDMHDVTTAGFKALVLFPAATPLIQGQLDALNVAVPQSLTLTALISTLFTITLYISSRNNGTNVQAVQPYITYTDATGVGPQTFGFGQLGQIIGSPEPLNSQNYTFPLYCIAGSPITISTAFVLPGSNTHIGTTFNYDLSVRIVQMPNNTLIPLPGGQFIINALSIANN